MRAEERRHDPFMGRKELDAKVAAGELQILQPDECPLFEADDRYQEAHYFLSRMMDTYHQPNEFRWNLNAFVQALRNVTFVIQKLLAHEDGYTEWYESQQEMMGADELLRKFLEGRNIVVKQRNLEMKSTANIGVFKNRQGSAGFSMPVSPWIASETILFEFAPDLQMLPDDHPSIGEEYGVKRDWIAPELGDENVVTLCDTAWVILSDVLYASHEFIGKGTLKPQLNGHDPEQCNLLTETDVNPSLAAKWGWTD